MAENKNGLARELKRTLPLAAVILIGWTLIIALSLIWVVIREPEAALSMAMIEARSSFNKDVGLHQWAASHGGVYVPANKHTPPSPYLAHIPERDILTPSGKKLTLMNPAYMLRQFMGEYSELYGARGKITSLELLNPQNAPDAWESEALKSFVKGEREKQELSLIDTEQYLRLMQPLRIEEGCLKCHGHQGYQVGDIRGGVSVAIAMAPYRAHTQAVVRASLLSHGLVWVLVLVAILVVARQRQRRLRSYLDLQCSLSVSEERLSQETQRLAEIIRGTNVGTWEWDRLSGEITLNERCTEIFGYSLEELMPVSLDVWQALFHPADRQRANELLNKNFSRELNYYECETRMRHKKGHWVWVLDRGKVVTWAEDGKPLRMSGTLADISERKRVEAELIQKKTLLESTFRAVPDALVITDIKRKIVQCNPGALHTFGYQTEELLGGETRIFYASDAEFAREGERRFNLNAEEMQKPYIVDYRRKNGETFLGETLGTAIRDPEGQVLGYLGLVRDVSERMRAEQELLEREEIYHALFENNHSAMLLIDPEDGTIVDVNPAACRFYGYSRPEILQRKIFDLNLLSETEIRKKMGEARAAGQELNFQHRLASGEIRDVEVHCGPILIHGRELLCSMVYDVTTRKYVEETLHVSERKHKHLAEVSPSGIWQADSAGKATYISPRWSEIIGIPAEDALGAGWTENLHPEDRERMRREWNPAARKGEIFRAECRFVRPDGATIWTLNVAAPERDELGKIVGWVGTITDISELKQTEQALRENEERLSASLQEKEVLLREIHHRVKNNLQIISSLLQLQARQGTPEIVSALAESERRVKVMAHLHEKLYQSEDLKYIDTHGFLCSLVDDIRASQLNPDLPVAYTQNIEQIELSLDQAILVGQIFSELLSNAIKHAFPDKSGGEISISLRRTAPGQLELSLADNGVGLPDDFDSSKSESLGWRLVQALASKLAARIEVERENGTCIRLLFDEVEV